jgi:hypothetical protein
MFKSNKYTTWYYNIIDSAQARNLPRKTAGTEIHHIMPKCMGGERGNNLVVLTTREHFICHWLLTKMVSATKHKWQMWNAFGCMLWMVSDKHKRYKVSSHLYAQLKIGYSNSKRERMIGDKNPRWGTKHTPETKAKMSRSHAGRVKSPEECKKLSDAHKGKPKPGAARRMSGPNNPNNIKVSCVYCKNEIPSPIFKRWHGDKCRKNPENPDANKHWKTSTCKTCSSKFEYKVRDSKGVYCSTACVHK